MTDDKGTVDFQAIAAEGLRSVYGEDTGVSGEDTGVSSVRPQSDTSGARVSSGSPFSAEGYDGQRGTGKEPDPFGEKKLAETLYDKNERDSTLSEASGRLKGLRNAASSAEEKMSADPYYAGNHAKDSPLGNLNNRSYKRTLAMSRMADLLNSQRFYKAGDIGARTSKGGGAINIGSWGRYEPVETEETRQMRADERLDEAQRERQIGRAENIKDWPQKLKEIDDNLDAAFANYQDKTGVDLSRDIQRAVYEVRYTNNQQLFNNRKHQVLLKVFGANFNKDLADAIQQMDTVTKEYFAQGLGWVSMDAFTEGQYRYIDSVVSRYPPEQQPAVRMGLMCNMAMDITRYALSTAGSAAGASMKSLWGQ